MIATDLDGTLIARTEDFHLYPIFRDKLEQLRTENGVTIAVCTGRSLRSFDRYFSPMRMMGVTPDFVIVKHSYIYSCGRFGYNPHVLWNIRTRYALWLDRLRASRAISGWHKTILKSIPRSKTSRKSTNRLSMQFQSREATAKAAEILRQQAEPFKRFQVFEYRMAVDLRAVPFMKGFAVSRLLRHLKMKRENVLTVGDGHNDISMLDKEIAGMRGCPANSEPEVMQHVSKTGGHIAGEASLGGVLEIIDAYREGTVSSELPAGWVNPSTRDGPASRRHKPKDVPFDRFAVRGWICAAVVVVVVMVFATYNLLPFAEIIRRPFDAMIEILRGLLVSAGMI
jgi:HAD superfamily hydrolase (TIGR01484 family)